MSFYIVPTPIGNLEDITLRALRVLKEVDLVLCEDTRTTKKLLSHYDIRTPLRSYHSHSKLSQIDNILDDLEKGKNIAIVSDAGTPAISDPGSLLISKIRKEMPWVKIESLPGASAIASAFASSGIVGGEFVFIGFMPHKKGRETIFKEISESKRPIMFYESTHRIIKTLESLDKFCPKKRVIIIKEISKIYEDYFAGSASEVLKIFKENPEKTKGEFVVIVS